MLPSEKSSSLQILPHLEFVLRPLPGYSVVLQPVLEALAVRAWKKHKRPPAPRSVKEAVIRRFADREKRNVLIETGTFFGDMLAALRGDFARLYSIELHPGLGKRAIARFAGDPAIHIIVGDSATRLEPLLRSVGQPAVYWLDGHYSGRLTARGVIDTPILQEIEAVLRSGTTHDVVLIDDARKFGTDPAYPTLAEVERYVRAARPTCSVRVEDDIVQITPG